ncbi:MAG TPA: peptidylprolyl isomerase, partial [Opitutales bacterium]|nr:peptidylprolyl isomerase [Opitutales bacterium]
EEILNREARALNLDQDDPIIRRELRGKMEFTLEDSAKAATPTDAQLNDFLQKHAATYRRPDGSLPSLAEVRDQVTAAWQYEQRRITANTAYDKLRARYVVDIQKPTATAANATVNTSATAAAATSTSSSK